jgi:hypothetical protein
MFEPVSEFWVCSETNFRLVRNSFQRAKWVLGNSPLTNYLINKRISLSLSEIYCAKEQSCPPTTQETSISLPLEYK